MRRSFSFPTNNRDLSNSSAKHHILKLERKRWCNQENTVNTNNSFFVVGKVQPQFISFHPWWKGPKSASDEIKEFTQQVLWDLTFFPRRVAEGDVRAGGRETRRFVTGQDANITGSFLSLSFALLAGLTFTSRGTGKETVLAWSRKEMTGVLFVIMLACTYS